MTDQGAGCAETEGLLLEGVAESGPARAWALGHLGRCSRCRAALARIERTRADVKLSTPPLDDVRRARIRSRLAQAVDELATRPGPSRVRRLRAGLLALALAAAAVIGVGLGWRDRPGERNASRGLLPLSPYQVGGASPGSAGSLLGGRFDRLVVPAGATVRARLGDRARVTLVGPAEIAGVSSAGATIELTLARGILVADYDHRRGGRLQIRAPDGVTEVIGTLFCVEVQGASSRVSVGHGRVSVQPTRGPARRLSDGQAWTTGAPAPDPVSATVWRLLRDHEGAEPERGSSPAAALPAAPPSMPAPLHRPAPRGRIAHVRPAPPPPGDAIVPEAPTLPPAEAPPATPALPAPPVTPESLYQAAESAMARRDWPLAARRLREVIATGSHSPLEDVARYELAELALRAGDRGSAVRALEELLATDREPALREPARLLQCEIAVQAGDGARARRCLRDFRASFPASRHDVTVLGWLVRLSPAGCGGDRAPVEEYLRRYPAGPVAPEARRRSAACPSGSR